MRYLISFLVAFAASALIGRFLIPWLHALKAGQSIKEIGPVWHMAKQGTPTMGGIMFIAGIFIAILVTGWQDFSQGRFGALFVFLFALVFGVIGFLDDFMKVKYHKNEGLTAPQKFLLQLAAAIVFTVLLRYTGYLTPDLYIPFFNVSFQLPWAVYMVFAAFVIVATVNAVNLTDGVDGLATGVTLPVALFYLVVSLMWKVTDLSIFAAALVGGLCAFLIYNFHPAKVFMGDTGSLFLGGTVCGLAFALDIPLDHRPGGDHLPAGDSVRHHPSDLFQTDPRQAHLPHGAPPPPLRDGRLERGEALYRVYPGDCGLLCPGLLWRHGQVSETDHPS